nr:hypothetical protein [Tanacetum cinerariifolium]
MLPVTQIDTFYNGLTLRHRDTINAAAGGTFMKRRPEECYDLLENKTAHHNDWDTSVQRSESSSSITSSSYLKIVALKAEMAEINKNLMKVLQINQQVKAVAHNCETCGGPHSYNDCPATVGQTQNVYAARAYNQGESKPKKSKSELPKSKQESMKQSWNSSGEQPRKKPILPRSQSWSKPTSSYQAPAYQAPDYQAPVHQASIPQPQVVTTTEFTNYMKANDAILKNMQTNMTSLTNSNLKLKNMFGQFMKMNTTSSSGSGTLPSNTITNPKEDLKGITTRIGNAYKGPMIPTTSSPSKVVEHETEVTKDTPIVAVVVKPVVAPVSALKPNPKPSIPYPLLTNKEKLFELARTPLNEHLSAVLLKKLPEKLGDPGKFLIPCDSSGMDECLALADLDASINLMPLSVWNKLSILELSPTCMTLELVDRLISRSVGVAIEVFVKLGTFHFLADFVVVNFDADPQVPLILRRSFLKTRRALIDVYEGELTLRVGKEGVTFNLDQTSRYFANYDAMSVNRIDLIDVVCEDDFLLEETDAFLAINDEPISPEINDRYYDLEGDILLLEEFLNDDLSSPPLPPQKVKGDDKLPVIIAKDLKDEEKTALIKVLKSHKQALAWQLSNIKGIHLEFYTHKILIEDDFKPTVQPQRSVTPLKMCRIGILSEGITS